MPGELTEAPAQPIPAHRPSVQIGAGVVFVLLLFGALALWRRVSRKAELEHADALLEERYAALEDDPP